MDHTDFDSSNGRPVVLHTDCIIRVFAGTPFLRVKNHHVVDGPENSFFFMIHSSASAMAEKIMGADLSRTWSMYVCPSHWILRRALSSGDTEYSFLLVARLSLVPPV